MLLWCRYERSDISECAYLIYQEHDVQEMCQTSRTYVCTCNCNAALRGDGAAYIYIYIYMLLHIYCPSRCAASLFSLTAINPGWGCGPFLSQKCASLARPTGGSAFLVPCKTSAAVISRPRPRRTHRPRASSPWMPRVSGRSVVGLHCTPGMSATHPFGYPTVGTQIWAC